MFRVEMDTGNSGYGWHYNSPREVYDDLVGNIGHDEAANVEGWCELACIGEVYWGDHFQVYVLEDN